MIALIDSDIVCYRTACSAENDDVDIALIRADILMKDIMEATGATSFKAFLTGENNFRKQLTPSYKANRTQPRPKHWEAVRQFLVTHWKAEMVNGYEADDAIGMEQKNNGTVCCSIDKDLLQLSGHHYNFVKKEFKEVTYDQGLKAFYAQTLIGDTSDNVIGVSGIGPKKAAKILDLLLPEEYYEACRELYNDDERYHLNCKLLWIWREPNGVWSPPIETKIQKEAT